MSLAASEKMTNAVSECYFSQSSNFHDDDYFETPGNLSYRRLPFCDDGCFCPVSCPDERLLQRVIRWVKIIGRSKHAMTVLFGVVPLVFGLLFGIYLGRRYEQWLQNVSTKVKQETQQSTRKKPCRRSQFNWWTPLVQMMCCQIGTAYFSLKSLVAMLLVKDATGQCVQTSDAEQQRSTKLHPLSTAEGSEIEEARLKLLNDRSRYRESGVELELLPKHIAFIMDGNRRFGSAKYSSTSRGHVEGGYKLRDMVHWCLEECIQEMTVYAFSTENWNRSKAEIDALMSVFCQQCEALRKESIKLEIVVRILSTETDPVSLSNVGNGSLVFYYSLSSLTASVITLNYLMTYLCHK